MLEAAIVATRPGNQKTYLHSCFYILYFLDQKVTK
jgi:hypothetical protein